MAVATKTSYEGVKALLDNMLKKYALGEEIPKEYDAVADEAVETFYSSAYHFYKNGKYRDALMLFRLLTLMDPMAKRCWMGLAASQQLEKEYDGAMASYAFAALLDDKDPLPHMYAAECAMLKGDNDEARQALSCAERLANNDNIAKHAALLKERWFGITDNC